MAGWYHRAFSLGKSDVRISTGNFTFLFEFWYLIQCSEMPPYPTKSHFIRKKCWPWTLSYFLTTVWKTLWVKTEATRDRVSSCLQHQWSKPAVEVDLLTTYSSGEYSRSLAWILGLGRMENKNTDLHFWSESNCPCWGPGDDLGNEWPQRLSVFGWGTRKGMIFKQVQKCWKHLRKLRTGWGNTWCYPIIQDQRQQWGPQASSTRGDPGDLQAGFPVSQKTTMRGNGSSASS